MLFAIDVGNTQTVIGLYEGDDLRHMWRLATNRVHTADEIRLKLTSLINHEGITDCQGFGAALASVVPPLTGAWAAALRRVVGSDPVVCSASAAGELFASSYANPAEIGADRVADAVAAVHRYGAPVVVVDFGTATNIEVIDADGRFRGGVIAPGLESSAAALFSRATKLGETELVGPGVAIGGTTVQAVQAGIVYGEADRVDGLLRRIFRELGYPARVLATGGLAGRIMPHMSTPMQEVPNLTLEGLRLIHRLAVSQKEV
ncbi:type III pantothenate kinase [Eggerthellaceae bacterium zg-997]|nr:type III pantothenate kinase [Eggerthellaceae bacterium zg-997]